MDTLNKKQFVNTNITNVNDLNNPMLLNMFNMSFFPNP